MKTCSTCKYAAVCLSTSLDVVFVCFDCRKILGCFAPRLGLQYREVYLDYSCPVVEDLVKKHQLVVRSIRCVACIAARRDRQ